MPLLLGIDLGTTAVKVGLFSRAGRQISLARAAYPTFAPEPLWAEQEPADWWRATVGAIRQVLRHAGVRADQIAAIGLSGQTPGQVLVDADGRARGRAIIWRDRRATREAALLRRRLPPRRARRLFGQTFPLDAASPASRILWLARRRPEDLETAAAIVQPKDYIALQLTGVIASDLISNFGLAHLSRGAYHTDLTHTLRIPPRLLPPLHHPEEVVGPVTARAARLTGLRAGTPVVVGTIDAWCSVYGAGALEDGAAVDVAGASEVVGVVARRGRPVSGIVGMPLWTDLMLFGGPTQVGGAALMWIGGLLGGPRTPDAVLTRAARAPAGAGGLVFLPYLAGERTPLWDSAARGVFFGLALHHDAAALARAVVEGVAFAVRHILEVCTAATGTPGDQVRVCGGGARRPWNAIKADVTGRTFVELAVRETAALGAAMLAGVGSGIFADLPAASRAMVHVSGRVAPHGARHRRYETLYRCYRDLYPRVRTLFTSLAAAAPAHR